MSDQVIRKKLENVLKTYNECAKKGKFEALDETFDITKVDGNWLCAEDKQLYHLQIESKGQVGYSTGKLARKETIHPSKRPKLPAELVEIPSTSYDILSSSSSSDTDSENSEYEDERLESSPPPTREHNRSKVATNLVTSTKVSTSKASKICKQLASDGIDIPTPSQQAIYKSTFKEAEKFNGEMIENLQLEQWSLHFHGKKIENNEYQVVLFKNERTEVKLYALRLKDGKAETIAKGIAKVLHEYNLWNSVKMIVTDTTNVNTGKKNGVVIKLQRMFLEKGISEPQFVGCQLHILDRILRVVMDEELDGKTRSPDIEYPFVSQLVGEYDELKSQFSNGTEPILEKSGWRDDMKFLFHLTRVFGFFEERGQFPLINFPKLPNVNNARWNSGPFLLFLHSYLCLQQEIHCMKVCRFISYDWANYWFTDQMYNENDFDNLSEILKPYKKGLQVLENHWNKESSTIEIPRSNQCAERAIKVMQELSFVCKNKDNLQPRFILTNKK